MKHDLKTIKDLCVSSGKACQCLKEVHAGWQVAGGAEHAATLCWICAANVDSAVQQWSAALDGSTASVDALQVRQSLR